MASTPRGAGPHGRHPSRRGAAWPAPLATRGGRAGTRTSDIPVPTCRGYLPRQAALVVPISNDKWDPGVHYPRQVRHQAPTTHDKSDPGRPPPTTSPTPGAHHPRQVRPRAPTTTTSAAPGAHHPRQVRLRRHTPASVAAHPLLSPHTRRSGCVATRVGVRRPRPRPHRRGGPRRTARGSLRAASDQLSVMNLTSETRALCPDSVTHETLDSAASRAIGVIDVTPGTDVARPKSTAPDAQDRETRRSTAPR
jgi:hypothetical protein